MTTLPITDSGELDDAASTPESVPPVDPTSLKLSWAYQWRIPFSAASIFIGVGLTIALETPPLRGTALSYALDAAGWLCLLAGVTIRLWSAMCLGGRKSRELVDVGPYSVCRNPLYVGTLLIAVSQIFFYRGAWAALGLLAPAVIYAMGVVPAEEWKLATRLGDAYTDYCGRVPRWWPRPSRLRAAPLEGATRSRSFRLELLRTPCWLSLPLLAELLFALRQRW